MAKDNKEALVKLGKKLVAEIEKGKNPTIELPVRSLSNVSFDRKNKTLMLGNKTAERSFFNVAHSKKFLQTVEVASVIKNEVCDFLAESTLTKSMDTFCEANC